jgi:hypothetical protein
MQSDSKMERNEWREEADTNIELSLAEIEGRRRYHVKRLSQRDYIMALGILISHHSIEHLLSLSLSHRFLFTDSYKTFAVARDDSCFAAKKLSHYS